MQWGREPEWEGNEIGNCKGHKLSTLCLVEIE